jgi:hypothetical protein
MSACAPISEVALRCTHRRSTTDRDFLPWRFSDAGRQRVWIDPRLPAAENLHKHGQMSHSKRMRLRFAFAVDTV